MKGPELLEHYEDNWETDMGAWFPGERVVLRGRDLLSDLAEYDWLQLFFYAISGKIYDGKKLEFMNSCYVIASSFPDPRLWNNRVAALAGTARSTVNLAISSATAVSEATLYGRRPDIRMADFLVRAKASLQEGGGLDSFVEKELKEYRAIPGFGRPVTKDDERVAPLLKKAKACGLDKGSYLQLVFEVQDCLDRKRKRLYMNITSIVASVLLDIGVSTKEYYMFCILAFSAGMFPCVIDASNKPEGALFPLSVGRINYVGKINRNW